MPGVVWADESKASLGFEIGHSYDDVTTVSHFLTGGQSSCGVLIRTNHRYAMLPDHISLELYLEIFNSKKSSKHHSMSPPHDLMLMVHHIASVFSWGGEEGGS